MKRLGLAAECGGDAEDRRGAQIPERLHQAVRGYAGAKMLSDYVDVSRKFYH